MPTRKYKSEVKKQRFNILLDLDVHEFLARDSYDDGISMSEYVQRLFPEDWSKRLPELQEKQKSLDQKMIVQRKDFCK